MSIVSVQPKSFILALFIRDDNERFLLGDNGYDFKDSQLHFAANTIENDEVQKQGADGVMVAGQVRRASVQSFDGYVGDATMAKETIEQMRRDFIAFFLKGHHYRVIYVDCNRNAWQRKGGYLVDAPEVKELWQIHPEYHVGLNFEDVNYYSYDEDADGNEILANLVNVPVSTEAEGGLVWDEDGAVSEDAGDISYDTAESSASGKSIAISDAAEAPLASFQLDGETSQNGAPTPDAPVPVNTTTGENVVKIAGKNIWTLASSFENTSSSVAWVLGDTAVSFQAGTYTFSCTSTASSDVNFITYKYADNIDHNIAFKDVATLNFENEVKKIAILLGGNVSISNIQLEKGSTATTYEPYHDTSYEVNLGKNLLNPTGISSTPVSHAGVDVSLQSDGTILLNGTATGDEWVNIASGDFETAVYNITDIGQTTVSLTQTDGTLSASVSNGTVARVIHDISNGYWAFFMQSGASYNNAVLKVQFEKGSTATDFAPYFEPIELCKIGDYQDYIYKSGGKWYVHKECGKLVVASNDVGLSEFTYSNISYAEFPKPLDYIGRGNYDSHEVFYSDAEYLGLSIEGWDVIENIDKVSPTASITTFWVGFVKDTSLDSMKAALDGSIVYYQLATPTDTEITNATLIGQLNALLTTARTFAGTNNIFTITPNEQGTLEIGYYTKYQPMVGSGGYVWEAGGAGGPTIIMNNSIDNVSPVWTIYGPTTNPQLENATTGETIEYVGVIAQGQTLTIDMGEQTASLDGLNVISNLVGDFVQLAPGRNNIIYSVSGEAGASELGWSEIVG